MAHIVGNPYMQPCHLLPHTTTKFRTDGENFYGVNDAPDPRERDSWEPKVLGLLHVLKLFRQSWPNLYTNLYSHLGKRHVLGSGMPTGPQPKECRTNTQTYCFTTVSCFCYRHVMLPKEIVKLVPKNHLMSEDEWRSIGVQQSQGWQHYMHHGPG